MCDIERDRLTETFRIIRKKILNYTLEKYDFESLAWKKLNYDRNEVIKSRFPEITG
jgi:hypothetical protein